MKIDSCVAHAIHADLDILEALPEALEYDIEDLEEKIEIYVKELQATLSHALSFCRQYLESGDVGGLADTLLGFSIPIPVHMLRKMCSTIMELYPLEASLIGETKEGQPIYEMKMTFDVKDIMEGATLGA